MPDAEAFLIRPATLEDVDFLADTVIAATRAQGRLRTNFDEAEWRTGWGRQTARQIRGEVAGSTTSVIEVDGERAGRLRVVRGNRCIELAGIQLVPRVQRRGIGTAIIESLKAEASAHDAVLEIGVEKDNPDAHRLYLGLGLVQVSESDSEYQLRWSPETAT